MPIKFFSSKQWNSGIQIIVMAILSLIDAPRPRRDWQSDTFRSPLGISTIFVCMQLT